MTSQKRLNLGMLVPAAAAAALAFGTGPTVARATEPCGDFGECKVLIEINSTDGDIGFHFLMDGDDLNSGALVNPKGTKVFGEQAKGPLKEQKLTETFAESAEPIAGYFAAVGIRTTIRALERAAFFGQLRDKKLRPLAYAAIGLSRTLRTTKRVARFRHLLLFLIAFMLYNDGIQTVIEMATAYGTEELRLEAPQLMLTLLIIQAIAVFGALLFGRIAGWIGTKRAVMVTLVLWSAAVLYGYFIHTATEYFALGGVVGLVMGGSQALSRSFYGSMIPEEASAEFYGFYSVFSKFSSIWGPLVLAVIRHVAGSARLSIVSLIVFFLTGLLLLYFVDEKKAKEAKVAGAF